MTLFQTILYFTFMAALVAYISYLKIDRDKAVRLLNILRKTSVNNELQVIKQDKEVKDKDNPLNLQVGGSHYKDFRIQPIVFIYENNLSFAQGSIIQYVCRYKSKNGRVDLEKAKHFIDLLIEMEYGSRT